jgi:hypothetical protein
LSARAGFDVGRLAAEIAGEVITPDRAEYEAARRVWNGMIDQRPAVIARCERDG